MTTARELTNRLAALLAKEHGAMADFLVALADFDQRESWAELGHTSLFYFLRRELGLSAGAAQYRKTAAGLVRRFPEVEAALRAGRLCLSSVVELARVLTPENAGEVLPRFFGLSSREAAAVAASIRPVEDPPRRAVVTLLRPAASAVTTAPGADRSPASDEGEALRAPETTAALDAPATAAPLPRAVAPAPRTTVEPLSADLNRLHVTVSARVLAKLEAARDALSHSHPGASFEEVIEAGLDLVLERHAKRRGLVEKPLRAPRPCAPDHVPAHVKREVWTRAKGRCEALLASGGVCGSTRRLEFHHLDPVARGGASTADKIRLHCDVHHDRESRAFFGDEWMERFRRKRA
jgi:hypothetical protein